MVPRSCGKGNRKPSTRQNLGPQLREGQGKEHPSATNSLPIAKQPRHQGTRWCPNTVKHLCQHGSMVLERDLQDRAVVFLFFFWRRLQPCLMTWAAASPFSFLEVFNAT